MDGKGFWPVGEWAVFVGWAWPVGYDKRRATHPVVFARQDFDDAELGAWVALVGDEEQTGVKATEVVGAVAHASHNKGAVLLRCGYSFVATSVDTSRHPRITTFIIQNRPTPGIVSPWRCVARPRSP